MAVTYTIEGTINKVKFKVMDELIETIEQSSIETKIKKSIITKEKVHFTIENKNKYIFDDKNEKDYKLLIKNKDEDMEKDIYEAKLYKKDIFIECDDKYKEFILKAKSRAWLIEAKISEEVVDDKTLYYLEEIAIK